MKRAALGIALLLMASSARADAVTVFAAASLKPALDAVAAERRDPPSMTLVYAGTATLARQIDAGADADVFLSADTLWMDWLAERGHLVEGRRRDLLSNALVLIAPQGRAQGRVQGPADAFDLRGRLAKPQAGDALAMPFPDAVPAGRYGKAALEAAGFWDIWAPRLVPTQDVRAALAFVARGAVPLGIVYRTDALSEPSVTSLGTFPADSHPRIVYPMAGLGEVDANTDAILTYLASPAAMAIFDRHGFVVADGD